MASVVPCPLTLPTLMARTSTGDSVSVRLITLTLVGFLLGALAAGGIGVRVIREVRALDDATSLPIQNIARTGGYHVDANETLISSVALVPSRVTVGDGGLALSYDLISIAPSFSTDTTAAQQSVYPKRWLLEASGGVFEGSQDRPDEPTAVFPLLAGGSLDQVDTVRVVEAFVAAPFEATVTVSAAEPTAVPIPGVEITLVAETSDGAAQTIELRITAQRDAVTDVRVVGEGPGWIAAAAEGDSLTLTREADGGAGAAFGLLVFGTAWVPIEGEFTVNVGGLGE